MRKRATVMTVFLAVCICMLTSYRTYAADETEEKTESEEYVEESGVESIGETTWQNDFSYTVDETEKCITLQRYNGKNTDIVLPSTAVIDGDEYSVILNITPELKMGHKWGAYVESIRVENGVSLPENATCLFSNLENVESLNLNGLDVSGTTAMGAMFQDATNLKTVNVSGWDITKVNEIRGLFVGCKRLKTVNLQGWDFSNIPDGSGVFSECISLEKIYTPAVVNPGISIELPRKMYEYKDGKWLDTEYSDLMKAPVNSIIGLKTGGSSIDPKPDDPDEPVVLVPAEEDPMSPVPVIAQDTNVINMVKGQKFTLPENGWSSCASSVLSISKKNLITAKKKNNDPITITKDGRIIYVYISEPVMLDKTITVNCGGEKQVRFDYDSENLEAVWYSNAPDIATVSEEGKVTAVGKGTATITAYVNGKAYNCKVKVLEDIPAEERTLHMSLEAKKTINIKGIKNVTWISDDEDIVSVNKKNKVTANAIGETVLRTEYQGKECRIRVFVENPSIISKEILSTGKNKYKLDLKQGITSKIDFASIEQPVIFKSNKGEIAYVAADGTIVANKTGKAVLTTKINGKKIIIKVTVK